MTVPALLLLVHAALAATPAAPSPSLPSEKELRADAHAWVEALCAEHKDKCESARGALAGYESLLPETARCETGPCDKDQIQKLALGLEHFHQAAAALPAVSGKSRNDLLRLGALGGVRLGAAAARENSQGAAWLGSDDAAAAATVESLCLEMPGAVCDAARQDLAAVRDEESTLSRCEAAPCPFEPLDELAFRAHDTMERTLDLPLSLKTNTLGLFSAADHALDRSTKLLATFVDGSIDGLKKGTDGFERRVAAAEKDSSADVRSLPGDAQAVMTSYQEASLAADRLNKLLGYEKAGAKREAVNTQVRRLGALRGRAFAAVTARGLATTAPTDALAVVGGLPAAAGAGEPRKLKPGVALTTARPTLLDERALPPPPGAAPPPPPIIPGTFILAVPLRLLSKDPLVADDAKRRMGQTQTVGTPGAYAKFVYEQGGNYTCAVASQVSALRAMGMLPTKETPEEQEKQSAAFLGSKGYFGKGTAAEYSGELLISKGVLVEKHLKSQWPALEAAVRRGSLIQAGVDATPLWNLRDKKVRAHSILVTGGEVDKKSGKLLGVYINDTGDDPPKGGRFVPIELMQRAWRGDFTEVLR